MHSVTILPESPRDFFDSWFDVVEKYAVGEEVDFVIMCGDFFHKRTVPPETMNYAYAGLSYLKKAGIPVISIEGNHDQKNNDSDYSWLRSLSNWGLLYLLEPTKTEGRFRYEAWNEDQKRGGYVDIGRARIFGSDWFGATANTAIPMLTESLSENQREDGFHIMLLHTDVEGHQTHPIPALTVENLKKLRSVTDYVGLGHTHKRYEIDNWAFNPGSLEITSISEYEEVRGAWLVEVDEGNNVSAAHVKDYVQRPFFRKRFEVDAFDTPEDLFESLVDELQGDSDRRQTDSDRKQIVEITLFGQLGFPNSSLELDKIRKVAAEIFDALHVRIKNHTVPIEYGQVDDRDTDRESLERKVIERSVSQDKRFRGRLENVTEAVIGAKRMALSDEPVEKIADFVAVQTEK